MPKHRSFLPSGLTAREKRSPALRRRLSACIRAVEKSACPPSAKRGGKYNYGKCRANPVAVCRKAVT